MSTSTTSNYNDACRKFRENRSENPKSGPGEKISKAVEDTDGNGKDNVTRGPNGKKIGPPIGHIGVSYHNKATHPPLLYHLDAKLCACYKKPLVGMRLTCKLVRL